MFDYATCEAAVYEAVNAGQPEHAWPLLGDASLSNRQRHDLAQIITAGPTPAKDET